MLSTASGKNLSSITPPLRVIRALSDYTAQKPFEISFRKGDFFHVFKESADPQWIEACNTISNVSGLVPASLFQVLGRNVRDTPTSATSSMGFNQGPASPGYSSQSLSTHYDFNSYDDGSGPYESQGRAFGKARPQTRDPRFGNSQAGSSSSSSSAMHHEQDPQKPQQLYGVALYDFEAEQTDELDAKAGDTMVIVAQSSADWFLAKHIGKLGGPGLIPVSYVEIRDMATGGVIKDVGEMLRRNNAILPQVDEWKRAALGQQRQLQDLEPRNSVSRRSRASLLLPSQIVAAYVASYVYKSEQFWFRITVERDSGITRTLFRQYEDFYDLQMALLYAFPEEAKTMGEGRVIPYMPGPVDFVNETITAQRRIDLDAYVQNLWLMPMHIIESSALQQFFAVRAGDYEEPSRSLPANTSSQRGGVPFRSADHRASNHRSGEYSGPVRRGTATSLVASSGFPSGLSSTLNDEPADYFGSYAPATKRRMTATPATGPTYLHAKGLQLEQRRVSHVRSEQKRRTHIRNKIEDLRQALPEDEHVRDKLTKTDVLSRVEHHMYRYQKEESAMRSRIKELEETNQTLRGQVSMIEACMARSGAANP